MHHLLDRIPADRPLIDLSQGAPGYPPPAAITDRLREIAGDPTMARYGPPLGVDEVRRAVAEDLSTAYGASIGADHVAMTTGCNQAFSLVASTIAAPGDNVVLVLPYYFNHHMWLELDNLEARLVRPATGVAPTVDELASALDDRTRAIVLVTPGNPTGLTLEPDLIAAAADLASARDVVLILDETYRSFVPGDAAPHEVFRRAGWADHVVSLHSFSKDLAIPGHRTGCIVGHPGLLAEASKLIDCITICPTRIGQEAVLAGLADTSGWRAAKVAEIAANEARFRAILAERPGGFELHAAGAYYGWVSHDREASSDTVAERLLAEQGVYTLPGSAFDPEPGPMLRFSFANASIEQLDTLGDRLSALSR